MNTIPVQVMVACSHCNARYRVKESQLKIMKEMKCHKCGKKFTLVPLPASTLEAGPAPVSAPPVAETVAAVSAPPVAPSVAAPAPTMPPPPAAPNPPILRPIAVSPSSIESVKSGSIFFKCSKCSREVSLPKTYAGKKVRCKQCSEILIIPGGNPAPESPAPATPPPPPTPPTPAMIPVAPLAAEIPAAAPLPVAPLSAPPAAPPIPTAPLAQAVPKGPAPLALTPIALDAKPVVAPEVQAELQTLKNQVRELERRSAEADRRATEAEKELQNMAGALNAKLESHREELSRYYENEFAAVENRIKDLTVRREELARYFETEQAVAEARIQDIRERQMVLKN